MSAPNHFQTLKKFTANQSAKYRLINRQVSCALSDHGDLGNCFENSLVKDDTKDVGKMPAFVGPLREIGMFSEPTNGRASRPGVLQMYREVLH